MTNLLTNGSFENGFRLMLDQWQRPLTSLNVGVGWNIWNSPNDPKIFEAKPANTSTNDYPDRVHSGTNAQQWFWASVAGSGGIYQQVQNIVVGGRLKLSAWIEMWSSSLPVDKTPNGRMFAKIGIDPYGGIDPESRDIVWSKPVQDAWEYRLLEVEAIAQSSRVTVWVWSLAEWRMLHNDMYVDDVVLEYTGTTEPPGDGTKLLREQLIQAHRMLSDVHNEIADLLSI